MTSKQDFFNLMTMHYLCVIACCFQNEVTGLREGKNTSNVLFKPAGVLTDTETVVDDEFYTSVKEGDTIVLHVKPGMWGSKWYYVSK